MKKEVLSSFIDAVMKWCVYAVVFAAPFSKSIAEAAIIVGIIGWSLKRIIARNISLPATAITIPFLIYIALMVPSLFVSVYPALSMKAFFTKSVKYLIFYFVIVESINTRSKVKDLFTIALLSASLVTIDGFVQYFVGVDALHLPSYPTFKARFAYNIDGYFRGFPTACFPYPNDLSAWILLILFPILSVVMFGIKKMTALRGLLAFIAAGLFSLLVLAKTRGAWVALGASTVYIALSKRKMWLIILLILVIGVPFLFKTEASGQVFAFSSLADRFGMWGTSLEIFKQHPILGNGTNTFFSLFRDLRSDQWKGLKGSYAHNCYLQMACDIGLIGLAGFVWLMWSYFNSIVSGLRSMKDPLYNSAVWGISIGVFAFLIHSFFDTNLYSLNLAILFWSAIGIGQALLRTAKAETL